MFCLTHEGLDKIAVKRTDSGSVAMLYVSRFQVTYLGSWWDTRDANRSVSVSLTWNRFWKIPDELICSGHWGDIPQQSWFHLISNVPKFRFLFLSFFDFSGKSEPVYCPSECELKSFLGTWKRSEMKVLLSVILIHLCATCYMLSWHIQIPLISFPCSTVSQPVIEASFYSKICGGWFRRDTPLQISTFWAHYKSSCFDSLFRAVS